MSGENRSPSEEVRRMLDERGIEYETRDALGACETSWCGCTVYQLTPESKLIMNPTPEQAIAATVNVGETYTREECEAQFVRGFSLGCLPSGSDPCWDENSRTLDEHMAELGWVRKDATTVGRSCASCPEADNPDSYIVHLQSALKWHDEHVPRPTNPNATCVVLQGERPPEEVLFVREDGKVMHYLPDNGTVGVGTCQIETTESWLPAKRYHRCKHCGAFFAVLNASHDITPRVCPNCGKRILVSDR